MHDLSMAATKTPDPRVLQDLGGRAFDTIEEAATVFGVSARTARRWAADYITLRGTRGIPVVQITKRRRLVPVAKLLELAGGAERGRQLS